jgi:hypothetical protein
MNGVTAVAAAVQNSTATLSSGRAKAVRLGLVWGARLATKRLGASKPRMEGPESAVAIEATSWD